MLTLLQDSLTHAIMITGFVLVMMLVIEYLNVLTQGVWQHNLRGSRWQQYLLAAFLGATPGCMGAFAVVALYSHRVVSLGAVVAAMIATSGADPGLDPFCCWPVGRVYRTTCLDLGAGHLAADFWRSPVYRDNSPGPLSGDTSLGTCGKNPYAQGLFVDFWSAFPDAPAG